MLPHRPQAVHYGVLTLLAAGNDRCNLAKTAGFDYVLTTIRNLFGGNYQINGVNQGGTLKNSNSASDDRHAIQLQVLFVDGSAHAFTHAGGRYQGNRFEFGHYMLLRHQ